MPHNKAKNDQMAQKKDSTEKHLNKGAQSLVDLMKTPEQLLEFLTEGLRLINDAEKNEHTREAHFILTVMIENIVMPWYRQDSRILDCLVEGLRDLHDVAGHEGFQEATGVLMGTISSDLLQNIYQPEKIKKFSTGLQVFFEMDQALYVYEKSRRGQLD